MRSDIIKLVDDKPTTTSLIIAKKFEREHKDVLKAINNLECSKEFFAANFCAATFENRGKNYPMYVITRDGFSMLAMGFTGPKAMKWKEAYISAFSAMESELIKKTVSKTIEWRVARGQTRLVRHDLTDCIKRFVDYATAQGSKNASMYYSNITKMEYSALSLISQREKVPSNFRDTLQLIELSFLMTAEYAAQNAIEYGMSEGLHYKDIYALARQKVLAFAETVRCLRIGEPKFIKHPEI